MISNARGHSQLMRTKCVLLGFSHLDLKGFQVISSVDIIFSLPIRHGPSKSHL